MTASNIPFKLTIFNVGKYSLVYPHYYDLQGLPSVVEECTGILDLDFRLIVSAFQSCSYTPGQQDPWKLFDIGGDCQPFAIYLKHELDKAGIRSGFVPRDAHVYNWVEVYGMFWKVDLTVEEVSVLSLVDKERIFSVYPELRE